MARFNSADARRVKAAFDAAIGTDSGYAAVVTLADDGAAILVNVPDLDDDTRSVANARFDYPEYRGRATLVGPQPGESDLQAVAKAIAQVCEEYTAPPASTPVVGTP